MKLLKIGSLLSAVALLIAGCGGAVNATIGGTVAGLAGGTTLVLLNNGANALTITANGSFTFNSTVGSNGTYNVTVQSQPSGQTCNVSNGVGTVDSGGDSVTSVSVNCVQGSSTTSAVSVSVSSLFLNETLVLLDNGNDTLTVVGNSVTNAGGTVVNLFPTPLSINSNYNVTVKTQPAGQNCTVTNGTGQIPSTGSAPPAIVTCS